MDKLRALQYFNQAAETGSFAAAARHFQVSAPAVVQLVGALERSLGCVLFHRTRQGLALSADGERYYQVTRQITTELRDVEQHLGPRTARPRGTLTIGLRASVGMSCVLPRLARFVARYPDIEIVLRPCFTAQDIGDKQLDLAVLAGWPPDRDFVVKPLAQTRLIVCAAPQYWARMGEPRDPDDLREHDCLIVRSSGGTLVDRWIFARGDERRTVDVKVRVVGDDLAWIGEAAAAGIGVLRVIDLTLPAYLSTGRLLPVLPDWESLEAPMIFAAYPPAQRRSRWSGCSWIFLPRCLMNSNGSARRRCAATCRAHRDPRGSRARMGDSLPMLGEGRFEASSNRRGCLLVRRFPSVRPRRTCPTD